MKRKIADLSDKERIETLDVLYTTAGAVKGREATKAFLKDLLTVSERVMLGRRILIAHMLIAGENMRAIAKKLKVGFDTVARVQAWLRDQLPGYEDALKEMDKELAKRKKKSERPEAFSYGWLKKKYPLHFLFFPD